MAASFHTHCGGGHGRHSWHHRTDAQHDLWPPAQDIQSGNCAVHNTCLVDFPQKGVLYAPWRIRPTPFWSPFARNAEALAPRAMTFMVRRLNQHRLRYQHAFRVHCRSR